MQTSTTVQVSEVNCLCTEQPPTEEFHKTGYLLNAIESDNVIPTSTTQTSFRSPTLTFQVSSGKHYSGKLVGYPAGWSQNLGREFRFSMVSVFFFLCHRLIDLFFGEPERY